MSTFQKKYDFYPLFENYHWFLAVQKNEEKMLVILEPFIPLNEIDHTPKNKRFLSTLRNLRNSKLEIIIQKHEERLSLIYNQFVLKHQKLPPGFTLNIDVMCAPEIPHQSNGYDCGVFLLEFMKYIALEEVFNFSCDAMPFFRREIGGEIKNELITGISEISTDPFRTSSAAASKSEKERKTATSGVSSSLQGTSHKNVQVDTNVVGCKILKFSNPIRRNLCFSNAVATVLMNIPDFITGLQENELVNNPILIELKRLFDLKNESRSSTLTFRKIIEDACLQNGQLLRSFNDNNQHDAAEFLTSVFEHMDKKDLSSVKIKEKVFWGLSQTTMFCSNTNCNISEQLDLEILSEIIPVNVVGYTLETCLEAFFNTEEIERKCQNCGDLSSFLLSSNSQVDQNTK